MLGSGNNEPRRRSWKPCRPHSLSPLLNFPCLCQPILDQPSLLQSKQVHHASLLHLPGMEAPVLHSCPLLLLGPTRHLPRITTNSCNASGSWRATTTTWNSSSVTKARPSPNSKKKLNSCSGNGYNSIGRQMSYSKNSAQCGSHCPQSPHALHGGGMNSQTSLATEQATLVSICRLATERAALGCEPNPASNNLNMVHCYRALLQSMPNLPADVL